MHEQRINTPQSINAPQVNAPQVNDAPNNATQDDDKTHDRNNGRNKAGKSKRPPSLIRRLCRYQAERFPLASHMPLIFAFIFGVLSFCDALSPIDANNKSNALTPTHAVVLCIIVATAFFQLRISDEFKNFETDLRHRPHRPLPRGLVTRQELGATAAALMILQGSLTALNASSALPLLLALWIYGGLMWVEFFVGDWLKTRTSLVVFMRAMIMPLIALFVLSWSDRAFSCLYSVPAIATLAFANGLILEIGRKIRTPADERTGIRTYSFLWGLKRAIHTWAASIMLSATALIFLGQLAGATVITIGRGLTLPSIVAAIAIYAILRRPAPGRGKLIAAASGLWTLVSFILLGVIRFAL
ncbi:putative 4-hydroxybenzoate polyprenyltransferase [Azospirillaceae bacterium]